MNNVNENILKIQANLEKYNSSERDDIGGPIDTQFIEWIQSDLLELLDDIYESLSYLLTNKQYSASPSSSSSHESKSNYKVNRKLPPKPSILVSILQLRVLYTSLEVIWIWQYSIYFQRYNINYKEIQDSIMPSSMILTKNKFERIEQQCKLITKQKDDGIHELIGHGALCLYNIATFELFSGMILERNMKRILISFAYFLCCPIASDKQSFSKYSEEHNINTINLPYISKQFRDETNYKMKYLCLGSYQSLVVSNLRILQNQSSHSLSTSLSNSDNQYNPQLLKFIGTLWFIRILMSKKGLESVFLGLLPAILDETDSLPLLINVAKLVTTLPCLPPCSKVCQCTATVTSSLENVSTEYTCCCGREKIPNKSEFLINVADQLISLFQYALSSNDYVLKKMCVLIVARINHLSPSICMSRIWNKLFRPFIILINHHKQLNSDSSTSSFHDTSTSTAKSIVTSTSTTTSDYYADEKEVERSIMALYTILTILPLPPSLMKSLIENNIIYACIELTFYANILFQNQSLVKRDNNNNNNNNNNAQINEDEILSYESLQQCSIQIIKIIQNTNSHIQLSLTNFIWRFLILSITPPSDIHSNNVDTYINFQPHCLKLGTSGNGFEINFLQNKSNYNTLTLKDDADAVNLSNQAHISSIINLSKNPNTMLNKHTNSFSIESTLHAVKSLRQEYNNSSLVPDDVYNNKDKNKTKNVDKGNDDDNDVESELNELLLLAEELQQLHKYRTNIDSDIVEIDNNNCNNNNNIRVNSFALEMPLIISRSQAVCKLLLKIDDDTSCNTSIPPSTHSTSVTYNTTQTNTSNNKNVLNNSSKTKGDACIDMKDDLITEPDDSFIKLSIASELFYIALYNYLEIKPKNDSNNHNTNNHANQSLKPTAGLILMIMKNNMALSSLLTNGISILRILKAFIQKYANRMYEESSLHINLPTYDTSSTTTTPTESLLISEINSMKTTTATATRSSSHIINNNNDNDNDNDYDSIIYVLGILSGILELGQSIRSNEEEALIRSFALPLLQISIHEKVNLDIANMSKELSNIIWSRSLTSTTTSTSTTLTEPVNSYNDIYTLITKMKNECIKNSSPANVAYAIHTVLNSFLQYCNNNHHIKKLIQKNNKNMHFENNDNISMIYDNINIIESHNESSISQQQQQQQVIEVVLEFFKSFLEDFDSFVYLGTIKAIVSVVDIFHKETLHILISWFTATSPLVSSFHKEDKSMKNIDNNSKNNDTKKITLKQLSNRTRSLLAECICKILRKSSMGAFSHSYLLSSLMNSLLKIIKTRPNLSYITNDTNVDPISSSGSCDVDQNIDFKTFKIMRKPDDNNNEDEQDNNNSNNNHLEESIQNADYIVLRQSAIILLAEILAFTGAGFHIYIYDILDLVSSILTLETTQNVIYRNKQKYEKNNQTSSVMEDKNNNHIAASHSIQVESFNSALNIRRSAAFLLKFIIIHFYNTNVPYVDLKEYSNLIETSLLITRADQETDNIICFHIETARNYWEDIKIKQINTLFDIYDRSDILEKNPKIKILSSDF